MLSREFPRKSCPRNGGRAAHSLHQGGEQLRPFYDNLKRIGVEKELRSFYKDLADYRNGFDHAWTAKARALPDIAEKGKSFCTGLGRVLDLLKEHQFLLKETAISDANGIE